MAERQLDIKISANVKEAHYDPDTQQIRCVFMSGHSGYYSGCSEDLADEFERADSSGKFVASVLKPMYPYHKIG